MQSKTKSNELTFPIRTSKLEGRTDTAFDGNQKIARIIHSYDDSLTGKPPLFLLAARISPAVLFSQENFFFEVGSFLSGRNSGPD